MRSVLVLVLLGAGCWEDAPHLNPLDPASPDFRNAGSISGIASDRAFRPISGASVTLQPGGMSVPADAAGRFLLEGVAPGTYTLTCTAPEAAASSDAVEVRLAETTTVSCALNLLPSVGDVALTTVHVSRWWPQNDVFRLEATAEVNDGDGLVDVGAVTLRMPESGFESALNPGLDPGLFAAALNEADLPGSNLHALLGRQLEIVVTDQTGSTASSGYRYLSRIIDEVPETVSPSGSQDVPGGSPLLAWSPPGAPFPLTFRIEVFRVDDDVETLVYTESGLPSTQLSTQVAESFPTGQYYWVLWIADDFGNRSRSREAGFIVP